MAMTFSQFGWTGEWNPQLCHHLLPINCMHARENPSHNPKVLFLSACSQHLQKPDLHATGYCPYLFSRGHFGWYSGEMTVCFFCFCCTNAVYTNLNRAVQASWQYCFVVVVAMSQGDEEACYPYYTLIHVLQIKWKCVLGYVKLHL